MKTKLFRYELQKIFSSRLLIGLLISLLLIHFFLTLHISAPEPWEGIVEDVYRQYQADPLPLEEYRGELEALAASGIYPCTFSGDERYSDLMIVDSVIERNRYFADYPDTIAAVITATAHNISDLKDYGYKETGGTVRTQLAQKEQYERLLQTLQIQNEYTKGYDVYLNNQTVCAFILLAITTVISFLYLHDDSVHFHVILQATKNGRAATACAKLLAGITVCAGMTIAFSLATFAAVGLTTGYSSAFNAIQAFEEFARVPWTMTVWEYLGFHTILRLLAFAVYTCFLSVMGSLRLPYLLCYAGNALFAGVNGALFYRTYSGTVPVTRYLNLASMTDVCQLTGFYRAIPIGNTPVRCTVLLMTGCAAICALCAGITVLAYSKNWSLFRGFKGRLRRFLNRVRLLIHKKQVALCRPRSCGAGTALWIYELRKIRPVWVLLLVVVLLAGRGWYVGSSVGNMSHYEEALYYTYITELQDLTPQERALSLQDEQERMLAILYSDEAVRQQFENGQISSAEYTAFLDLFHKTRADYIVLERVMEYQQYLERKSKSLGAPVDWIYSSGYEKYFDLPSDYFLYGALILLCFQSFSVEYIGAGANSGFLQILRTTKKGRVPTFRAKICLYALLASLLGVVFRVCGYWIVSNRFEMSAPGATLCSIPAFSAVASNISIREYLIIDGMLSVLAAVLLAIVVCLLSYSFQKGFSILTMALLITGLPELLGCTVLPAVKPWSILSMTSPKALFCQSHRVQWLNSNSGYLLLVCLGVCACIALWFTLALIRYRGPRQRGGYHGTAIR